MRKILYFFVILFTVVFMSNCENEPLETENTPENLFVGKSWEYKIDNDGGADKIYQIKLSFEETMFSLYHRQDSIKKEVTFTGTYYLYYIDEDEWNPNYWTCIKFISDEPSLNGSARYGFTQYGALYLDRLIGLDYNGRILEMNYNLKPVN